MAARHALGALVIAVAALVGVPSPLHAQVGLTHVVSGLTQPVFVGHAGDNTNRLFIVERAGRIRVLPPGASMGIVFLDITGTVLSSAGEQGLLGLAFHPQYATNRRFFVFYTRKPDGALRISEFRATADPNLADPFERPLLTIPHSSATNHNGGMLAFGKDGYLYISVGDGGGANDPANNAQNLDSLLGKLLRINVNTASGYLIPSSNPFAGSTPGRDEIYAYGFRNPWRFSVDRSTGEIWVGDVGQNLKEEIDGPVVSGGNYGWRVFEATTCTGQGPAPCNQSAFKAPVIEYLQEGGRCSVTGGYVYRGSKGTLTPGTYIYGDFCTGEVFASIAGGQSRLLDTYTSPVQKSP
jgi:glucose/arabinose dehydrogenase